MKWELPARLPFRVKLKQAIPACPAVLFLSDYGSFLCYYAHFLYILFPSHYINSANMYHYLYINMILCYSQIFITIRKITFFLNSSNPLSFQSFTTFSFSVSENLTGLCSFMLICKSAKYPMRILLSTSA